MLLSFIVVLTANPLYSHSDPLPWRSRRPRRGGRHLIVLHRLLLALLSQPVEMIGPRLHHLGAQLMPAGRMQPKADKSHRRHIFALLLRTHPANLRPASGS